MKYFKNKKRDGIKNHLLAVSASSNLSVIIHKYNSGSEKAVDSGALVSVCAVITNASNTDSNCIPRARASELRHSQAGARKLLYCLRSFETSRNLSLTLLFVYYHWFAVSCKHCI